MRSKMRITLAAVLLLVVLAATLALWKTDRLEAQDQRPVRVPQCVVTVSQVQRTTFLSLHSS